MRTSKIWAQFSAQTTQNLLRVNDQNVVLWAIDENMGTNLQAFYKHFYIGCLKTQKQQLHFVKINHFFFFFLHSGRARVNRAGASQYGQGAAPSDIGLAGTLRYTINTWSLDRVRNRGTSGGRPIQVSSSTKNPCVCAVRVHVRRASLVEVGDFKQIVDARWTDRLDSWTVEQIGRADGRPNGRSDR